MAVLWVRPDHSVLLVGLLAPVDVLDGVLRLEGLGHFRRFGFSPELGLTSIASFLARDTESEHLTIAVIVEIVELCATETPDLHGYSSKSKKSIGVRYL